MANIVIYPKNIYSKPKYNLLKNNIIKSASINYSELIFNGKNERSYTNENVPIAQLNEYPNLTTIISEKYHNSNYRAIGTSDWSIYAIYDFHIRQAKEYEADNDKVDYYSYVALKKTIKTDTKELFGLLNEFTMNGTLKQKQFFASTSLATTNRNIEFFYTETFDPDNFDTINHESFWYMDASGTYHSAMVANCDGTKINVYCLVRGSWSKVEYQGTTDEIDTTATDTNFDLIYNDYILNLTSKINSYKFESQEISVGEGTTAYTVSSNEFISKSIARTILNNVVNKYGKGRKTVTVSVYADNYYNEDGVLVYDKTNGDLIRNGDIIKLYEYRNGGYTIVGGNTVRYKVTSSEFEYKGQPIIHLELLEEK